MHLEEVHMLRHQGRQYQDEVKHLCFTKVRYTNNSVNCRIQQTSDLQLDSGEPVHC